jgi:hypothetical protein
VQKAEYVELLEAIAPLQEVQLDSEGQSGYLSA